MRSLALASILALSSVNVAHAGDVYRCTAANGSVMYTNIACPTNSRVQHVTSYEPVPPSPPQPANEAAAEAAASALQARQAAQQAREAAFEAHAASQEASYEPVAERNGYALDGGVYPYYPVYGAGFRNHRHQHPGNGDMPPHPAHLPATPPRRPVMAPVIRR